MKARVVRPGGAIRTKIVNASALEPFPLWVSHHPGEPAYSLVARTAERNGMPHRTKRIFLALGVGLGSGVSCVAIDQVARLCEADASALRLATPVVTASAVEIGGQRIPRQEYSVRSRRWCPECMREHGAHLWWWDLRFMTSCHRHGRRLRDLCDCGKSLKWTERNSFSRCGCGRSIADAEAQPSRTRPAEEYLLQRLTGHPTDNAILDGCSVAEALFALRRLGQFALGPHDQWRDLESRLGDDVLIEAGFDMLSDFPKAYQDGLDRAVEGVLASDRKGWIGTQLAYGVAFTKWLLSVEAPQAVSGPLAQVLREHAVKHLNMSRKSVLHVDVERPGLTIRDITERSRSSHRAVRAVLVSRRLLDERSHSGAPVQIDRKIGLEIVEHLTHGRSRTQVAADLRVSDKDFKEISELGIVPAPLEVGARPRLPADSAETIVSCLLALADPSRLDGGGVSFRRAARILGIGLAELIGHAVQGGLPVVGEDPSAAGIDRILVDPNELEARSWDGGLPIKAISALYRISAETVSRLFALGAFSLRDHRHFKVADAREVEDFFQRHPKLSGYAEAIGISTKTLATALRTAGHKEVFPQLEVGQLFFRKEAIDAVVAERWPTAATITASSGNQPGRSSESGAQNGDRRIAERSIASV